MKKLYSIFLLILPFAGYGQDITNIPTDGLIAWYPFNGNADDESGHSLNGTVTDASLTTDRFGNADQAYDFNGSSAFIEVADNETYFRPENISISMWVLTRANSGLLQLMGKPHFGYYSDSWALATKQGNPAGHIFGVVSSELNSFVELGTGEPRTNDVWTHVVLTYDKDAGWLRVYINGVKKAETATDAPILYDNTAIQIGRDIENGNPAFYMDGKLDDLAIYDRALSEKEITALYAGPIAVKPGSGNALNLDGDDDYIATNAFLIPETGDFTVDFWVKNRSVSGFREFVSQGPGESAFFIGTSEGSNVLRCGDQWVNSGAELPLNLWTHLALVKSGNGAQLYLNGILVSTDDDYHVGSGGSAFHIGRQYAAYGEYANALLDEIRIWNVALTETEIRARMYRKIQSDDPQSDNLIAYYNFDQEDPNIAIDIKSGHNGALLNGPAWEASGAAIGDASAYTYGGSSVSIAHAQGESLELSHFSEIPAGVHVYVVNAAPGSTSGITGVGQNDRYFGVYHFGVSGLLYIASYHYAGNPYVNASNESGLTLYKRDNNADETWETAGLPLIGESQTVAVISQDSEYMLGSLAGSLPVTLIVFDAKVTDGQKVTLHWTTSDELNASHFIVEKSVDARRFTPIGRVEASGNSNSRRDYQLTDEPSFPDLHQMIYYRLRQVDLDQSFAFSRIVSVKIEKGNQVVYPNPVRNEVINLTYKGELPEITLLDIFGRGIPLQTDRLSSGQLVIKARTKLAPGLYILRAENQGIQTNHKVVVE